MPRPGCWELDGLRSSWRPTRRAQVPPPTPPTPSHLLTCVQAELASPGPGSAGISTQLQAGQGVTWDAAPTRTDAERSSDEDPCPPFLSHSRGGRPSRVWEDRVHHASHLGGVCSWESFASFSSQQRRAARWNSGLFPLRERGHGVGGQAVG